MSIDKLLPPVGRCSVRRSRGVAAERSTNPHPWSKPAERLTALHIAHRLDNLAAAYPHQVHAAHGIALARAPEIAPPDDRAVAGDEHFLGLEVRSGFSREALPHCKAGPPSDVARAIGRGLRVFDDAVFRD